MVPNSFSRNRLLLAALIIWIFAATARITYVRWYAKTAYKHLIVGQIPNWRELTVNRRPSLGREDARVVIIEFSDYQCPYCRIVEPTLQELVAENPDKVVIYRYNLPLEEIHPFARSAAVAAECASMQGILEPYQAQLFSHQGGFHKLDWVSLAKSSGVKDLAEFATCINQATPSNLIDRDIATATRLNINSTPTLVMNGARLAGTVGKEDLNKLFTDASKL